MSKENVNYTTVQVKQLQMGYRKQSQMHATTFDIQGSNVNARE